MTSALYTPSGGQPVTVAVSFEAPLVETDVSGMPIQQVQVAAAGMAIELGNAKTDDELRIGD